MKDPRGELAALSAELRRRVQREQARGRSHLLSPGLSDSLKGPVGASPGSGRASLPGAGPPASSGAARSAGKAAEKPAAKAVPRPIGSPAISAGKSAGQKAGASSAGAAAKPAANPKATPIGSPGAKASPAAGAQSRGKKLPLIDVEPPTPDHEKSMAELVGVEKKAKGCEKCGLCETRTHVVFSRGTARNRVMFVGEAPGANEDKQGLPFVGRAGQLLDQIIDAAGFRREEIYVTNILKCRPPQNRDPKPEEIAACTPYLERQIDLIQPKIICALGRFAAQFLTGKPNASMGELRGRIDYYRDRIMVLPTYHPAALLRNPNFKRVVWDDVQLLRKEYLR